MSLVNSMVNHVRRQNTPSARFLYKLGMGIYGFPFPMIKPLHSFLYHEWFFRTELWHNFWRVVYYEPMFKSQCASVGKRFIMEYAGNGSTKISGDLKIHIGDYVTMFDSTHLAGIKVFDNPSVYIGDHSYIGPRVNILVGKEVRIGSHCLITSHLITDNPGHSTTNTMARIKTRGGSPEPETIRPVKIGDYCFLAQATVVYPGVTIGDGVVARNGTHISHDVPPFCNVVGSPGVIRKLLPIPPELEAIVGADKYHYYLDEHRRLQETGLTYGTNGKSKERTSHNVSGMKVDAGTEGPPVTASQR